MDVQQMYEDFRSQYIEMTKAADAKHESIWGRVEHEVTHVWFESLAGAINDRMGISEQRAEIAAILAFFDMSFRNGSKEVKTCIDTSFVENLFWQVIPKTAAPVWAILPKNLQQLYIGFHGRSPK